MCIIMLFTIAEEIIEDIVSLNWFNYIIFLLQSVVFMNARVFVISLTIFSVVMTLSNVKRDSPVKLSRGKMAGGKKWRCYCDQWITKIAVWWFYFIYFQIPSLAFRYTFNTFFSPFNKFTDLSLLVSSVSDRICERK